MNHLRVFNDAIVTVGEFIDIQAAKKIEHSLRVREWCTVVNR